LPAGRSKTIGGPSGALLLLPLIGCGGNPAAPNGDDPAPTVPWLHADSRCWEQLSFGTGLILPLCRTLPVRGPKATVVRAVIVVHGARRNPRDYFRTMIEAVSPAGQTANTLVVAPPLPNRE
jgi:hypothetical protein